MSTQHIAVLGAGRMGCGIAQVFLAAGHAVSLYDPVVASMDAAPQRIRGFFDLLGQDTKALARLVCTASVADAVRDANLVIEAAPEKLALKQALFEEVQAACKAAALLATNTSAIPIHQIGARLADKSRFMGLHFWNPPHLVPLVEVIQTEQTTPQAIADAMQLLAAVGMSPVHVRKDIAGFIGNRLQHALKRECIALVANGVCDAETVDRVVKEGFGARLPVLGPLEQSDLVGLDLTLNIHNVLIADLDVTPGPSPYLQARVAAGETGMKVGKGFRSWTPEQAAAVQQRLDEYLVRGARERIRQREATRTDDLSRLPP
jgi:3-hydroxybutyryl-CoA dehydrogenase